MKRILIVDDSALILTQLEDALTSIGYEVAGKAASGKEAIRQAQDLRPDAILMDIVMPGEIDGIQAAREIVEKFEIPVIFLTGYEEEDLIERIENVGASGYILKPFKHAELKAGIEIALNRKLESEGQKKFYRDLVENTSDLIYVLDSGGSITFVNNTAIKTLGYSFEELTGKNIKDFTTPESYRFLEDKFRKQVKGEDIGTYEIHLYDKERNVKIFEVREQLNWDNDRVSGLYGIARDITDRKKIEEALRVSEEKYRSVVENTKEGIVVIQNQKIIYANPFVQNIMGFSDDEFSSRPFLEFVHPDDRKMITERHIRLLKGENLPDPYDYRVINKNSEVVWTQGTAVSITWEGKPTALVFLSDITEKKYALDEILYLKELNENIINNMIDSIDIVNEEFTIVFQNKSSRKKFGVSVGKKCYDFYHGSETPCDYCMAGEAIEKKQCFSRDVILDDGTCLEIHSSPIRMPDGTYCSMEIMRDITERKRAEEAHRESEERYCALYKDNPSMYFTVSEEGTVLSVNPYGAEQLGYTVDELVGQQVLDVFHAADHAAVTEQLKACLKKTGQVAHWEFRKIRKDGSMLWVREAARAVHQADGRPVVLIVCEDITVRKQAEEELKESERRYRLLAENANDIIFTTDTNLRLTYVSPSVTRVRGFTVEEAMAHTPAEALTPRSLETAMEIFGEAMELERGGADERIQTKTLELEETCKDGSIIWTETTFSVLRDEKGTFTGLLGITRDITERKRAEEALRESEAKFRSVFETSRDFIYITSLDGMIIDYNISAKDFFGYSDEEIRNMTILDVYQNPEDRVKLIEELKAKGFVQNHELKLKKKDGSLIDALATIVVKRDSKGDIIGFQGAVKDITQMRRLEQQLVQAEKLSGLGTMISGVAHELNNPLTAIIGNAEFLLMRKKIPADCVKSLEVILKESERAGKIVSGLLTFARKHKQERMITSINDIIMESYKLREYNLKVSNIDVRLSLAADMPLTYADPYQLQQVFTNIINNAQDALGDKGGGILAIRSARKDKSLVIEFEDDGPGIAQESIKKIFDPFFTTKDVGKGTGLGLSMAYGIIEDHGGRIDVESEPGRGAKFIVSIPAVLGRRKEKETIAEKKTDQTGKRILVIDDEEYIRNLLSDVLSQKGFIMKTLSSGREALALIGKESFDAIIMDIKMPGMEGKELYAHITNNYPEMAKKILFMTGDTMNEDTQSFLNVTGNRYIAKPFRLEALVRILNEVLEK